MPYSSSKRLNKNRKPFRTIIAICLVLVLIIGLGTAYIVNRNARLAKAYVTPKETINYTPSTEEEKKYAEDKKVSAPTSSTESNTQAPTPAPPDTGVTIMKLEQNTSSKEVVVQTRLVGNGYGECTLTLQKGTSKVSHTVKILFQPEFSTCMGFVLKSDEFDSAGTWAAILSVSKTDGTTATTQKTIDITK